jgi:hypothetical protein
MPHFDQDVICGFDLILRGVGTELENVKSSTSATEFAVVVRQVST